MTYKQRRAVISRGPLVLFLFSLAIVSFALALAIRAKETISILNTATLLLYAVIGNWLLRQMRMHLRDAQQRSAVVISAFVRSFAGLMETPNDTALLHVIADKAKDLADS